MILSDELAQKIVNTIMNLVQRNVNIFNREGIIIATGHPQRYKTFHKGAKDVIDTGSIIEIYPKDLPLYPGALQGVNLPIVFDDQIVGVVGIFGHPEEIRSTGKLVKAITELFLEHELLQKELHENYFLREKFIEATIFNNTQSSASQINRMAKKLNLNLELSRSIVLIDLKNIIKYYVAEYGSSELMHERIGNLLTKQITAINLIGNQDLIIMLDETLIILKHFNSFDNKIMKKWAGNVLTTINDNTKAVCNCGIGLLTNSFCQYPASYQQAKYCLANCSPKTSISSIYDRDMILQFAMQEALTTSANLPLKQISLTLSKTKLATTEMQTTLLMLLKNNLNINATATCLHIHRNTLLYRLNCLKLETDLDPTHSMDDAIFCRLILNNLQLK